MQRIEKMRALTHGTLLRCGTSRQPSADFGAASEALAQRIIHERVLPDSAKTLKCIAGGIAGGLKFYHNGIFAKYAVDNHHIFGNDGLAMKAAALEKKGLQACMAFGVDMGLNFPLMSVVDYAGFRIVTVSYLPISEATLCYGSSDGGRSIHHSHAELSALIEQCTFV